MDYGGQHIPYKKSLEVSLIDLLDLGAGRSTLASGGRGTRAAPHVGHAAATRHATTRLVHFGHDGVAEALELLQLVLELVHLGELVGVQPGDGALNRLLNLLLVVSVNLAAHLVVLDGVAHVVGVVLKSVLGVHLLLVLLVLGLVLLRLLHHTLNLLLGQAALVVGDGDLVLLSGGLVLRRHVEDTVGVNVEAHGDLGHAAGGRGDAGELELAQQVVVAGAGALTLVHLDKHTGLVVGVGGEHLLLLG